MSDILVVGSVAFDSIKSPFGEARRIVGGAASYFAVAASYFAGVRVVAVVGDDFGDDQMEVFRGRRIDVSGIERASGESFYWRGEYNFDLNNRDTIYTHLNVFSDFQPKIPESHRDTPYVFLANIHPTLQLDVLNQIRTPQFVGLDTMNYWIERTPEELRAVLKRVDMLVINDSEARQLSGEANLVKATRVIQAMGPKTLVIKKGEHGAVMTTRAGGFFAAPALPLEEVFDPTGAGDSFAGGFMGSLAAGGRIDDTALARAVIVGSAMASFTVEAFGLDRLLRLKPEDITARYAQFKTLTHFEAL